MFYFYKSSCSQALETPLLGFRELNGRKSCWTWPGSAPKPPRPFPEPCWTWPGSAPKPPRPYPEPYPEPYWTWPGSAPKPPRPSLEPSEPSPEPRWTCPAACTSAHRSYSGLKTPLAYAVGEGKKTIEPLEHIALSGGQWCSPVGWYSRTKYDGKYNYCFKSIPYLNTEDGLQIPLRHIFRPCQLRHLVQLQNQPLWKNQQISSLQSAAGTDLFSQDVCLSANPLDFSWVDSVPNFARKRRTSEWPCWDDRS